MSIYNTHNFTFYDTLAAAKREAKRTGLGLCCAVNTGIVWSGKDLSGKNHNVWYGVAEAKPVDTRVPRWSKVSRMSSIH